MNFTILQFLMLYCTHTFLVRISLQRRTKADFVCLNKVVDGPRHPEDFKIYLESLVDELLQLWEGVEMYDAYRKKKVLVRVMLVNCLQDGRATRDLAKQKDAGCDYGCRLCEILGEYLRNLHKYVYMGHRDFLPKEHPLRTDTRWAESAGFKAVHNHDSLMSLLDNFEAGERDADLVQGVEGRPEFLRLPYWDWARCHSVELMHILANVGSRLESMFLPGQSNTFVGKLTGPPRGNIADRQGRSFPGLPNAQLYVQAIRPTTSTNGRPNQLLKASTTKSKKKKDADATSVSKKKAAWWKDVLISKVFPAALKFGGVDGKIVDAIDKLCSCLQWMCTPTIKAAVS